MKESIRKVVEEYVFDYPTLNNTSLADKILEDSAITGKSHRTIRGFIGEVRSEAVESTASIDTDINEDVNMELPEVNDGPTPYEQAMQAVKDYEESLGDYEEVLPLDEDDEEEEDEPEYSDLDIVSPIYALLSSEIMVADSFEVENLKYKFSMGKKEYEVEVSLVDKIFCAYSRKGLNLTKNQIMASTGLDINKLNALMAKTNLTKDSEPFGPFTDEFMEKEDIYTVTVENASSLLGTVKETDSAALEALVRAYKKAYVEISNKNLKHDAFLREVVENVKGITIPVNQAPVSVGVNYRHDVDHVTVVLADLHLGLNLPVYNYDIAEAKLDEIAADINALHAKNVCITFLGDCIHTYSGSNHAGMWKTIEQGAWGANSITKPFEILLRFLWKVNNLSTVMSVSGNHDRTTADKEAEDSNEGSKLLFYMLKYAMPIINVVHTDHRTVLDHGNIVFINLHGDQGLDKKSADKIVWKYGDQTKFNMILEGHFHSRIISKEDDTSGYRKMHCPAFAPTDDYADRLGLGSLSGWLMIVEREGLPMVIDTPINYGTRNR